MRGGGRAGGVRGGVRGEHRGGGAPPGGQGGGEHAAVAGIHNIPFKQNSLGEEPSQI